jgi:integrase
MAKAYREGSGWAIRRRYRGHDIYLSGYDNVEEIEQAASDRVTHIRKLQAPQGLGPKDTTAAQAMQDYALKRLPFKKGAVQEAVRMNHYLRAQGLSTLVVKKLPPPSDGCNKTITTYFEVELAPPTDARKIPRGLATHRKAQLTQTSDACKHRAVLAGKSMESITRLDLQNYMDAMRVESASPATMKLEQALWRGLFNYAFTQWSWKTLIDNPATKLTMPMVDNERDRVMSEEEQELLDAAMATCKNEMVAPVALLLRETAMRSSEPLQMACWKDVDWKANLLDLRGSKNGSRKVPLSPLALQALRTLQGMSTGEPDDKIVTISYESLKASWMRACERAGIKNLKIHDLRHTSATRMALKTGNLFLVMALTGHKCIDSVMRYANVKATDVVKVMHAPPPAPVVQGAVVPDPDEASGLTDVGAEAQSLATSKQFEAAVLNATREVLRQLQSPTPGATTSPPDPVSTTVQAPPPTPPTEARVTNLYQFVRRVS